MIFFQFFWKNLIFFIFFTKIPNPIYKWGPFLCHFFLIFCDFCDFRQPPSPTTMEVKYQKTPKIDFFENALNIWTFFWHFLIIFFKKRLHISMGFWSKNAKNRLFWNPIYNMDPKWVFFVIFYDFCDFWFQKHHCNLWFFLEFLQILCFFAFKIPLKYGVFVFFVIFYQKTPYYKAKNFSKKSLFFELLVI